MKEILAPVVIMIKSKNIILITVIGILVIFSGCTGGQEKKVTETAPPTPAQTPVQTTIVQTTTPQALQDSYQVQVTEVRTLSDCIKSPYSSEVTPCTLINLQVKNNNVNKLDFEIVKEEVIAKYSRVLPGKYDKEVGLNDQCTRQAGMKFVLTENTQKIVGLCHPTINNADEPVLNVMAMINGVRQEYKFSLPS